VREEPREKQREERREEGGNGQKRPGASQSYCLSPSFSLAEYAAPAFFCIALRSFIRCRCEIRGKPHLTLRISRFFSGSVVDGDVVEIVPLPSHLGSIALCGFEYTHPPSPSSLCPSRQTRYARRPDVECMPGDTRIIPAAHFYFVPVEFTAPRLYRIVGRLSA